MIVLVVELTMAQAKAPATDAPIEPVAGPLQLPDLCVNRPSNRFADPFPIARTWSSPVRKLGEFDLDIG